MYKYMAHYTMFNTYLDSGSTSDFAQGWGLSQGLLIGWRLSLCSWERGHDTDSKYIRGFSQYTDITGNDDFDVLHVC